MTCPTSEPHPRSFVESKPPGWRISVADTMKNTFPLATLLGSFCASLCMTIAAPAFSAETNGLTVLTTNKSDHAAVVLPKGDKKAAAAGNIEHGKNPPRKETTDRRSFEQLEQRNRQVVRGSWGEEIIVPIGFFATIVGLVALRITAQLRRNKMLHETLRAMIEKGAPIPPELLRLQQMPRQPYSDLRRGLVSIGVGTGLVVLFLLQAPGYWPVGLIPLLMGVAFLITWKVERKQNGSS
ncbi:MAG: DUF6249 domain-containing protein [Verrucomicrobiae bacterium]|nr:DUF6249 domain-containing protein [Verrucomicrobiae bacterium]